MGRYLPRPPLDDVAPLPKSLMMMYRIRMKKKFIPSWMRSLPVKADKLTMDELRNFKAADKYFTADIVGPPGFQYLMRCYRYFSFFCYCLYEEKRCDAFNRCWDDLERTFLEDEVYEDGVFIQSWLYFDFPLDTSGRTALDCFLHFVDNHQLEADFTLFIKQMKQSRLGLHEEILSGKHTIKFRELFTEEVHSVKRTVNQCEKGEIFLTRLVECDGEVVMWGDPKCWPSQYKYDLKNNVGIKLINFEGKTEADQYRSFMKLAGPYWFSCVSLNCDTMILPPDQYLQYHRT
jgi:hypothetical protein